MTKAQRWQIKPARTESDLEQLEAAYRILDLYIWLSFRMEAAFLGLRQALCILLVMAAVCVARTGSHFAWTLSLPKGSHKTLFARIAACLQTCTSRHARVKSGMCSTLASKPDPEASAKESNLHPASSKMLLRPFRPGGSRKAEEAGGSPHRGGPAPPGTEQQSTDCKVWYSFLSVAPVTCKGCIAQCSETVVEKEPPH